MMYKKNLQYISAVRTHRGIVRSNNEDSAFADDARTPHSPQFDSYGIYIVADGMGGHSGGEVASRIAVEASKKVIIDSIARGKVSDTNALVKKAMSEANQQIYTMAEGHRQLRGMGSTITLGLRLDNQLFIGHVGDSRAYLIRSKHITQLTTDHSLVVRLLREGMITSAEVKNHPSRGIIYRCLGTSHEIDIESNVGERRKKPLLLHDADVLVFCSDGLTDSVTDDELSELVSQYKNPSEACDSLVNLANMKGGFDNISVVLVKVSTEN